MQWIDFIPKCFSWSVKDNWLVITFVHMKIMSIISSWISEYLDPKIIS